MVKSQIHRPISNADSRSSQGARPAITKVYSIYVVALLLIAYTLSFIDRQILSLLVGPIKQDMSISDTEMSFLLGMSFALFYTIMGLPLGRLADTKDRPYLIALGISVWSFMTCLCGLASTYVQLFLARMGVGVGEASLSPAAYSLIADSVEEDNLGTAISIYTMGIYLGGGLALIVGGAVVSWAVNLDAISLPIIGSLYSWQLVLILVGLPGVIIAPLILTLKEPRRVTKVTKVKSVPLKDVYRYFRENKKTILLHNFGTAFASLAGYGAMAWVPTYLMRTHALTSTQIGIYFGLIVLFCGGSGVICGGRISDKWQKMGKQDAKLRVPMIAALIGLVPSVLYPVMPTLSLVLMFLAVSTFFSNFMLGVAPAAIQEIVPKNMRGQFSALYLFIVNLIGLGIGPTAVALVTDKIFGDPESLKYSLVIVPTVALFISACLYAACLRSYRNTKVFLTQTTRTF